MRTIIFAVIFLLPLASLTLAVPTNARAMPATATAPGPAKRPALVVAIVIDQFRADYLTRFERKFLPATSKQGLPGGFELLMSRGAYFPFAEYDILQSMTCPGHATILTGSYPYLAGIPLNDWNQGDERVYCAEDPDAALVGAAQKSPHAGTSPRNLLSTTFGDELKSSGQPSRVVSLALKDRAAIMLGGHRADLALWLDSDARRWVSSRYYLPDGKLPAWVDELNKTPGPSYDAAATPVGIDVTEAAAERAIAAYDLGRGAGTDLLAISFSSHDYAGHAHGPNADEMEEMTIAEDRALARLFGFIARRVPFERTLLVLTGDHGIPLTPEYAREHKLDGGRIDENAFTSELETKLVARFGKPSTGKWLPFAHDLNWFVSRRAVADAKLELKTVLDAVRDAVAAIPGIAYAFTLFDYEARRLPPGMHERQILHTYFPGRSGDVIAIPRPYWIPGKDTAAHLTGYSFDRTVPLAIAGFGVKPGRYATSARVIDIAPTLSWLSGVIPPTLSEGRVLNEIIR
jgi:predicted AlkP superfamily pyrophosphatase or phosphodiesterase